MDIQASYNRYPIRQYYVILPDSLVFAIVLMFFVLPFISLQYSSISVIRNLNSSFILFVMFFQLFVLTQKLVYEKNVAAKGLLLLFVILYGLVLGLSGGYDIMLITKSIYITTAPLILFFMLLLSNVTVKKINVGLIYPLILIVIIDSLYSVYQFFFIDSYTQLWFYNPFSQMGIELKQWSYEKNGMIRATGIFTSPLENAFLLIIALFYFAGKAIHERRIHYIFAASYILVVGYTLGTRVFYLGVILGFVVFIYLNKAQKIKPAILILVFPFFAIIATYLFILLSESTIDLSAAGRLVQLVEFITIISQHTMGLGPGSVGIDSDYSFDSAYATWLVSYGLFFGSIIIYLYYWIAKLLLSTYETSVNELNKSLLMGLLFYSIVMIYISQFQYAMMTGARWYFVISAALIINKTKLEHFKSHE